MRPSSSWDRRVCASIVRPFPACLARAASLCGNANLRSIRSWVRSPSARQPAGRCRAPASSGARQARGREPTPLVERRRGLAVGGGATATTRRPIPEDRRRVPRSRPSGEGLSSPAALDRLPLRERPEHLQRALLDLPDALWAQGQHVTDLLERVCLLVEDGACRPVRELALPLARARVLLLRQRDATMALRQSLAKGLRVARIDVDSRTRANVGRGALQPGAQPSLQA